jgi:hypothetical protein
MNNASLPITYLWTWDHSTNWVLDDPGLQVAGCQNRYWKRPETFIEDYCRLTDLCARLGFGGIVIFGFLRDDHGGVEAAKTVAAYAASKGVRIMPGVGTTAYGGSYYEGNHEFNLETLVRKDPDCARTDQKGNRSFGLCPTHPTVVRWMTEGIQWLMETFPIGGVNLENGDFQVCYCKRCQQVAREMGDMPEHFKAQLLGYGPAIKALGPYLRDKWIVYATYTGFAPGQPKEEIPIYTHYIGDTPLPFAKEFPPEVIAQWTLSGMVRKNHEEARRSGCTLTGMTFNNPLPLTAFLDNGRPEAVYDNPDWPRGIKPPNLHSVGYMHQSTQCWGTRCSQIISTIKEGCLRSTESGLEGLSINGETSNRCVPWALNYLAFAHFIRHPEDDLRGFARGTLAPELGDEKEAQLYVEVLAHWDAGTLGESGRRALEKTIWQVFGRTRREHESLSRYQLWNWLYLAVNNMPEPHMRSFF